MTRFSVIIEEFTVNENDLLTHEKFLIILTSVKTLWKHASQTERKPEEQVSMSIYFTG